MPTSTKTNSNKNLSQSGKQSGFSKTKSSVVIKKRTGDLTPSKASAAAIKSQGQHARKKALIEKMSLEPKYLQEESKKTEKSSVKIPLLVRIFFGGALLLFCISFYKAILYPQLDINIDSGKYALNDEVEVQNNNENENNTYELDLQADAPNYGDDGEDLIAQFFNLISNHQFSEANQLLDVPLQKSESIKDHFTAFRMTPFLSGIKGNKLTPTNIVFDSKSDAGNDIYRFELSYVIESTSAQYDEVWNVIIKNVGGEYKIARLMCETDRCSFHPIFWPENFGLMR